MTSRTKIFLLWLLALAIPVQGFAAVTQLACAPTYQTIANVHPGMHTMSMSGMDHAAMHSMPEYAPHAPQDPTHHQASSCSSCTVCTIGAILPLALDKLLNQPLPADIHIATPEHGFVGYTPENPDRPPSLSI